LVGYLTAVIVVYTTGTIEGFSRLGLAAAIYAIGVAPAPLVTSEPMVSLG
jgi:hypothetical protein